MQRLLNEREIEQKYGVKARRLQKYRHEGGGPKYVKMGRSVLYDPDVVEVFLKSLERTSTSDQGLN